MFKKLAGERKRARGGEQEDRILISGHMYSGSAGCVVVHSTFKCT